ncbi:MAG: autotransporter-associated beta strand repeat-containing protein, partial [Patescibacteria group bacterium]|nr:autotransporter-associated beta strand repeat-containing protein [Patescibacteria group bacterium]
TLAGTNNFDLAVSGLTTVTGNATFHVNTSGVELYLNGGLNSNTPGAVISKSGGQRMRIQGNGVFASGSQVHVNAGTLELRGTSSTDAASTPLGAGTDTVIYLNAGTLDLRTYSSNSTFGGTTATAGGYHVAVTGNATINLDRYTGSGSGQRVRIGSLSIGSSMLTVNSGSSYYFGVNGPVEMTGSSIFNMSAPIPDFYGQVSGGRLIKQGSAALRLQAADNVNTYDGGSVINQGWLYGYNAGGLGSGDILVNPGGGVAMGKATTLRAGQIAAVRSSTLGLGMVGINYSAAPSTLLPNLNLTNAPAGIFAGGGNYTVSLDLGNLFGDTVSGDDRWYLGAIAWSDTYYRADALAPGAENTYRLGGGGGNMHVNRNAATSSAGVTGASGHNLLTGSAAVAIGMAASNLRSHGSSSLVVGGTNDYTGGTVVHRGMAFHLASAATATQSGAGTGDIHVYGDFWLRTAGTLTNGSGGNVNSVITHPGSRIRLDSNDGGIGFVASDQTNRWGDNAALFLDGARFFVGSRNGGGAINEVIGDVTFARGSSIMPDKYSTVRAYITAASLTRVGSGTLLIPQGDGTLPDQTTVDGQERFIVTTFNNDLSLINTNGMAAPYLIDSNDHHFVVYNNTVVGGTRVGFQQIAYESTNLNTASSTQKVNTAAVTLTTNPTVYALRTTSTITSSGANNTITIRSGGLIAAGGTINANLVFDDGNGPTEALIYTGATTVVTGAITASQITKFGTGGELQLNSATPVFDGPIVVNDGLIRLLTLNALGANATITLNGGGSANGSDTAGHGIVFAANTGNADEVAYTHGNVTSWDNNRILFIPGGNDRTQTVGDFTMKATGDLSVMQLRIEGSRNRINTGSITLDSPEAILHVHNNSFASGASSVIAPAALVGDGKSITKLGSAILELGDMTGSLTNSSLTVGQGALRVFSGASLGSSNAIVIDRGAALEIAASNFSLAGATTLTQVAGSAERWNVEDARGTSDYVLPQGVTLQLNTSITPDSARTITLTGGSLEPFLYSDSTAQAVFRVVGSNVTIDLADHSYLGQNVLIGTTGADMGQTNLMTAGPLSTAFRGAGLIVQGQITGAGFDLTKIGGDIAILAGPTSTYRNTIVDQGMLQIGANNALPTAGVLTTRLDGVFDLNGYDQQVGNLGVRDGVTLGGTGLGYSGTIVNSAYAISALTAGNADDHTYYGIISGNIALVKTGTGTLTLGAANTYIGPTTLNQGTLSVALVADGGLASHLGASSGEASNLVFDGGALRYTGASATTNRNFTLGAAGGTMEVAGLETLALTMAGVGQGSGGLTKGGSGTLVLANHQQYDGGTTVSDGALRVTTAGSLKHNASDKVFISADADNDFSTPGARLIRQIAQDQPYDGLGSQIVGGYGTRADIAKGTNTSGGIRDLSMAWREPGATEPAPLGYIGLVSDVLELAGMAETGGPHGESDLFVLTMSYDPAALHGRETELASTGNLYLAWLDPVDGWENAVLGNFGGTDSFAGVGAWTDFVDGANLAASLGHWGVDLGQHLVWAVANHNSQFAVMAVPEPTSLLLLASLVGLFATFRRGRRRTS